MVARKIDQILLIFKQTPLLVVYCVLVIKFAFRKLNSQSHEGNNWLRLSKKT
jgi:hypothetical protein